MSLDPGPERITVSFRTDTSEEAVASAKAWARHNGYRVLTLCSVKRGGLEDTAWLVELAVRVAA